MSAVEDPEKILDQAVTDMQSDLVKMRQASAQVIASQKRLQNKFDQAQSAAVRARRHLPCLMQRCSLWCAEHMLVHRDVLLVHELWCCAG